MPSFRLGIDLAGAELSAHSQFHVSILQGPWMFFAVSTAIMGVGNRHWNHSLVDWEEPLRASASEPSRGHDSSERCPEQIVAKLSTSGSLQLFRPHLAHCGSLQRNFTSNMVSNFQHGRIHSFELWQAVIACEAVTHITTVGVEPIDHGSRP